MKITVKKYGRWSENGNWQLESRKEKEISEEAYNDFKEVGGFIYNKTYNELYAISDDKLRMTVVIAQ